MRELRVPRNCSCGAVPGALHESGCDMERCVLCGMQAICCDCIYELCGMYLAKLETEHPSVYGEGPTDTMWEVYEAEVSRHGGRLAWEGEYPGCAACREFGLWWRMVPGKGWVECERDHPDATEDLNRLHRVARWDKALRAWVRRAS